jgi:hypothetical protein
MEPRSSGLRRQLGPQLIGRDEGPIRALLKQDLQSRSIGLGISLLLLQQLKALLQHSTHRREATSAHQGLGKSMLILAERHGTLDNHESSTHKHNLV